MEPSLISDVFFVEPSLEKVKELFQSFMSRPFLDAPEEITLLDKEFVSTISLPSTRNCKIALQTRIGSDVDLNDVVAWSDDQEVEETYFSPRIGSWKAGANEGDFLKSRQWLVAAVWYGASIQLYCAPLGNGESERATVLTAKLELPRDHSVLALGFYGNDGKSFLSSGSDGGTGTDGPYEVAFLCQTADSSDPTMMFVSYQDLRWYAFSPESPAKVDIDADCCYKVVAASEDHGGENARNTISAQSKWEWLPLGG